MAEYEIEIHSTGKISQVVLVEAQNEREARETALLEIDENGWGVDEVLGEVTIEKVRATVQCSLCGRPSNAIQAHLHQGKWICDESCWDERLRSSE